MPQFNNWKSLETYLNTAVNNTLKNEVKKTISDEIISSAEQNIYGAYSPKVYDRRFSLTDPENIVGELESDGVLFVKNVAVGNDSVVDPDRFDLTSYGDTYLSQIIEYGKVYPLWGEDTYTRPRKFIEEAQNNLESSDDIKNAFRKGLKRNGIQTD